MVFRFGGLPRLSCRMRLFGYLGTLIFQRRVQCRVRCFARRFLGCDSLGSGRWHQNAGLTHPVFPEAGSTICDQPESRDATRALAPA